MERDKLNLLQKYWQAETTLAEERELKQYFGVRDMDELDGGIFSAIRAAQEITPMRNNLKFSAAKSTKMLRAGVSIKTAAAIVLVAGLGFVGTGYYQQQKAANLLAVQKQMEADLIQMSKLLNESNAVIEETNNNLLKLNKSSNK